MLSTKYDECGICRSELYGRDLYIECNNNHSYHSCCLLQWFKSCNNFKCPLCMTEMDIIKGLNM